jgi:hypothetical protein
MSRAWPTWEDWLAAGAVLLLVGGYLVAGLALGAR